MRSVDHLLGWVLFRRRLAAARAWQTAEREQTAERDQALPRLLEQARGAR